MIEYEYDSKERYLILPKDVIKKEYGVSPDYADALALTFFDKITPKFKTERSRDDDFGW